NFSHLKIWGCPAHVKKHQADKLESRTDRCRFIGYLKETFGYQFYHPMEHKVLVARKAIFLEREYILQENSESQIELDEVQEPATDSVSVDETTSVEPIQPASQDLRRSGRVPREPERYVGHVSEEPSRAHIIDGDDPQAYQEATSGSDSDLWKEAMDSEIQSMYTNQVWNLVDVPDGVIPIGCKWIYKRKINKDGQIDTYKARLVAKGYRQRQGIDYDETFSPVAMVKSIRILLAIAAYHDYEVWQMDVKTTFLYGNLSEEVYMEQPQG